MIKLIPEIQAKLQKTVSTQVLTKKGCLVNNRSGKNILPMPDNKVCLAVNKNAEETFCLANSFALARYGMGFIKARELLNHRGLSLRSLWNKS